MRKLIGALASFAAIPAVCGCATTLYGGGDVAAISAERLGATAVANEPQLGYSDGARHIADCLASYRSYDLQTDRFKARGGTTRRCRE